MSPLGILRGRQWTWVHHNLKAFEPNRLVY